MKKYLLTILIALGAISFGNAQDGGEDQKVKDVKALYVAYVTKQLDLTPEEAQKFWPLHTQFENDLKTVKKDLPELQKQQAYLDVKKKYQDNFVRVLGANRCDRFFRIDGEFKRKLIEIRNQRQQNQRQRFRRIQ
ncbi:MAG TPA: hypothetical protein PLA61_05130 [Ferruginibacter sp.]|nr:hypothetical protein [Ferruginibacter sp.]MBN8699355.1 hypothetical protein [Chitinophagales bacterium]HNJ90746.1 hypothetical protein [Chitinophagales bacterium]HQR00201.1 hypothetical protein [Ferruginibacter sp.]